MPKKGSAKFSALKGTVQGTLSHRSSAHHSPRGKMQNIVPQKGSAQVSKRDSAEQSAPEGQCPKWAVQSTVHKWPVHSAQEGLSGVQPRRGSQNTAPGAMQEKRERENSGSVNAAREHGLLRLQTNKLLQSKISDEKYWQYLLRTSKC